MALKPTVFWGQDKDFVYLSVKVSNCRDVEVNVTSEHVTFSGAGDEQNAYGFEIDPYLPVITEDSSWKVLEREVSIRLKKEYRDPWPRLSYGREKLAWVRIDFDRFQYSDSSEDSEPGVDVGRQQTEEEREWQEAELFWRQFKNPLTIYLILFNLFQTAGFTYILGALTYSVVKFGDNGKFTAFEMVHDRLIAVQIASLLELAHALLGWVRSGVLTTFMQVFGRNLVLFAILLPHPDLQQLEVTFWLLVAWSAIEVFRYPYYLLGVLGTEHGLLTYFRYTIWIPLYPLGFVCEGLLILKALPEIDREQKFSLALPNTANVSFHFPTFLHIYLVLLMFGSYTLMTHMYHRRKAKIGPNPKGKASGLWSLVPGVHSFVSANKKKK